MANSEQKLDKLIEVVNTLRVDNLKNTIDNYSNTNRNIYIFFMLLLLTIFSIATRTDDESILKDSLVVFPILNIQVPTYYFYIVAPLIIFIVHFSVLFNLYQHIKRLREWMEKGNKVEKSSWLRSYMFNHLLSYGESRPTFCLLKFILWLTIFAIPLIVLVFLQYKFLPYHSYFVTNLNRSFIVLDLIVLIYFYPKIRNKTIDDEFLKSIWFHIKYFFYAKDSFLIIKISSTIINFIFFVSLSIFTFWLLSIPKTNNEKFMGKWIWSFIHRNIYLPERILVKEPPSPEVLGALLAKGEKREEIYQKYSKTLNLRGRDLRFANFAGSKFYSVDLREAQFQGASLSKAQLQRASLHKAQLQGIDLDNAKLQGAYLSNVQLQGADLSDVQFQGANLWDSQLQGTVLAHSQLQGVYLRESQLQGADLQSSQLQGADLTRVNFQGAYLTDTKFQGANLSYTELEDIYLYRTALRGIYAKDINLTNTYLDNLDFNTTFDFDKFIIENRDYLDENTLKRLQEAKKRVDKNIDISEIKKLFKKNKYSEQNRENYVKELSCKNKWIAKANFFYFKKHIKTNCPQMQKTLEEEFDIEF